MGRAASLLLLIFLLVMCRAGLGVTAEPEDAGAQSPEAKIVSDLGSEDEPLDLGEIDVQGKQQDAAEPAVIDLGSGDGSGEAQDVMVASPVAVSQIISAAEIERSGAVSVSELLARESGFSVNETFAGSEVTFQGLPAKFTTVLVDGQRLPGRNFERIDFSQLPLGSLERVEVIRGPQAAVYGSDNAGVVVNLITKRGGTPGGSLALELGSLGFNRQQFTVGGGSQHESWLFTAGRSLREAYDFSDFAPDTDGDSFRRHDFSVNYRAQPGRDRLSLSAGCFLEDNRGQSYSPPNQIRSNETMTRRFQGAAGYELDLGAGQSLRLSHNYGSYYHNFDRYWVDFPDTTLVSTGFKDTINDTHAYWQGYGVDYVAGLGIEFNQDRLESDRITGGKAETVLAAAVATIEYLPGTDWSISTALRYDSHRDFGAELSPRVSVTYEVDAESTLSAAAGRGYRSPSLREQHFEFSSPFGYSVVGNSDLTPETSLSCNLDYRRNTALGIFSVGLFRHEISDLIVFSQIQATPQVFRTENVERAVSSGIQVSAERRWTTARQPDTVGLGWDLTWLAEASDTELDTRLVNSPELDHVVRLFYEREGFDAEVRLRHSAARFVDRENTVEAPAVTTVDLTLLQQAGAGQWRLAALNLFDVRDGRYGPEPGRELRLEYRLNF